MSTASTPTYEQMMQPTLDALHSLSGQGTNADIDAFVIQALELPPEIAQHPHKPGSSLTEVEYRLQWTRTYLRQFGLIDSPRRGYWALTDMGRETLQLDSHEISHTVRANAVTRRGLAEAEAEGSDDLDGESPESSSDTAVVAAIGHVAASTASGLRSPTPLFPTYANARCFLQILDEVPAAEYSAMAAAILEQRGNPQEQVDWSNPDEWIGQRLDTGARQLAQRIWHESQRQLNPRYTRGCWYLTIKHRLLARGRDDTLHMTERGREFLVNPAGTIEAEIDAHEGLIQLLRLVAEQGSARRSDLLPAYGEYSRTYTTFQSDNVVKTSLYDRLRNLIDRGFVVTRGQRYETTNVGLAYLERFGALAPGQAVSTEKSSNLLRLAQSISEEVRERLRTHLLDMDPFKFEELVKLLLEEMGYENVATTAPTNDKGVDVIGTIELGISAVREVIQVKRHRGTISRPVLDQLRGSLHRFNAVRGTIITTGRFSKGAEDAAFERGAAPITLIDGERLLGLLLEYKIGVNKKQVEYFEFAPDKLNQFVTETSEA